MPHESLRRMNKILFSRRYLAPGHESLYTGERLQRCLPLKRALCSETPANWVTRENDTKCLLSYKWTRLVGRYTECYLRCTLKDFGIWIEGIRAQVRRQMDNRKVDSKLDKLEEEDRSYGIASEISVAGDCVGCLQSSGQMSTVQSVH